MNGSLPATPPACVVRSRADIRRVLAVGRPATLLSAPGAALALGPLGWMALVAAGRAGTTGDGTVADILDCADAAGRALEALRLGQRDLVLQADAAVFRDVAARAAAGGAILRAARPPALDLGALDWRRGGAAARLARWLGGAG